MPRRLVSSREPIGLGDLDVYHPVCRTRILITSVAYSPNGLTFEGICYGCDRYVSLIADPGGLVRELKADAALHG